MINFIRDSIFVLSGECLIIFLFYAAVSYARFRDEINDEKKFQNDFSAYWKEKE